MLQGQTWKLRKKKKKKDKESQSPPNHREKSHAPHREVALAIANWKIPRKLVFIRHEPPYTPFKNNKVGHLLGIFLKRTNNFFSFIICLLIKLSNYL
jgi:hypothetical protein